MQHWLSHDLFSWTWWMLLALLIVPWVIWWKLADRQRLIELVLFGALTAVISLILDAIGTVNLWWSYFTELIIHFPGLLVADITDIPVVFMLVHQYCSTWKSFSISMVFISLLFSYVIEPLFRWSGAYYPLTWEHFYSSIVYFLMGMLIRLSIEKMKESGQRSP